MHAAFDGGDAVREGVDGFVVAGVPLERDLELLALLALLEEADLAEQRLLRVVEVAHVVDDAAVVLEGLLRLAARSLVDEAHLEAAVEEGHDLESLDDGLRAELDVLEDASGPARR